NNSVRVSDQFMRAVEEGGTFGLAARLTGETLETVDAKGLFRKIAKAAWECADPGIQYDDTINNWHTCPETAELRQVIRVVNTSTSTTLPAIWPASTCSSSCALTTRSM